MEARLGSARHVNPESSRVAARGRGRGACLVMMCSKIHCGDGCTHRHPPDAHPEQQDGRAGLPQ